VARTGIWRLGQYWLRPGRPGRTYRKYDDDQVAGNVESCYPPPQVGGLTVDVALGQVYGPVPECRERNAGCKDGHDEPYPCYHDEEKDDVDGSGRPAVRENPPVEEQDGYPREDQAEMVE
jgi:hypothetical protein